MAHSAFTLGMLAAHPQNAAYTLEAFEPERLAPFLASLPEATSAQLVRELSPALAAMIRSGPDRVSCQSTIIAVSWACCTGRRCTGRAHLDAQQQAGNGLTDTALALSELLWTACAGIFSGPPSGSGGKPKSREIGDDS